MSHPRRQPFFIFFPAYRQLNRIALIGWIRRTINEGINNTSSETSNVREKLSTGEKKSLEQGLQQQLHDSIKVRWVSKFLIAEVLKNPPVYDSLNADKSLGFMSTYLNSLGYYRDSLNYAARIDTVGKEYRTTVDFNLVSTKLFHLDSISFNMFSDRGSTQKSTGL